MKFVPLNKPEITRRTKAREEAGDHTDDEVGEASLPIKWCRSTRQQPIPASEESKETRPVDALTWMPEDVTGDEEIFAGACS
ncbi:hypothetical protein MMC13_007894 [Lambiella insularis]|nr:hypothetical protein [Lambiella insularis]